MIVEALDTGFVINEDLVDEQEREIRRQISEYTSGGRKSFDLDFCSPDAGLGHVLRIVNEVPYGETRTYSEIAEKSGSSAIAIGSYCGRKPLPQIAPCHRVVGKNGLGGYTPTLEVKKKLLRLENSLHEY